MKRILSVLMVVVMLVSATPTAFASDSSEGTDIVMIGEYATEAYTVTVPAQLAPGESGEVVVKGGWRPSKMVTVSCPNSVTLTYEGQTIDVGVNFPGITQAGSMDDAINRVETISVESKSVAFGTWTGHLSYTVSFSEFIIIDASYGGHTDIIIPYDAGMTWGQWFDSDYSKNIKNISGDELTVLYDSTNDYFYVPEYNSYAIWQETSETSTSKIYSSVIDSASAYKMYL